MKKVRILTVAVLIGSLLAGCTEDDEHTKKQSEPEEIKELIQDYSSGKIKSESASVTSSKLIVTENDGRESTYDLPAEEFFVSLAPYVNETHPCTNHSLTSCKGELVNETFDVLIEDTEGNEIVNKTVTSQANGFIDLWVPRDKTFRLKITHNGKEVESEFSTFKDDGTCITNLQLM